MIGDDTSHIRLEIWEEVKINCFIIFINIIIIYYFDKWKEAGNTQGTTRNFRDGLEMIVQFLKLELKKDTISILGKDLMDHFQNSKNYEFTDLSCGDMA